MAIRTRSLVLVAVALLGLAGSVLAQEPHANRANWKQADRFSAERLRPFVYSLSLTPSFIGKTDTFWYSWRDSNGTKFWKVDPKARKKEPLFDAHAMAAALSELHKKPYDHTNLPITTVTVDEKGEKVRFTIENVRYEWDIEKKTLAKAPPAPRTGGEAGAGGENTQDQQEQQQGQQGPPARPTEFRNFSPDKKAYVYAKDHNLYFVETSDETKHTQLTTDGERYYSFGARAGTGNEFEFQQQQQTQTQQTQTPPEERVRAQVTWSEDSKAFYVVRRDVRKVSELYLVNSLAEPRPTLMSYKYAMPGEENVTQTELNVFLREGRVFKKLDVGKWKDQSIADVHWTKTPEKLRFVRRDRLQRNMELCEADIKTGAVSALLTESVENAFLERQNTRYVKPGGDFVWFSERSGFGHFYLYTHDGKLKNPITSGPWRADQIVDVDADKGVLYFKAVGREADENPYYRHTYRIGLDGKGLALMDPGDADHGTTLAPSKKYSVDVFSRTDLVPKAVVRDDEGKVVLSLEEADTSKLTELGWKMPETFVVKSADGVTNIYGNLWKPYDFDATKKYPIIANVYPGPQTEAVGSTFSPTNGNQRLAQLGFIVIQIGNRGGQPLRSNAYHSFGYYNLRDYGLADKKAGIEQLAERHPWIDVDKVGIYGHSGGGFMTAAALLLPPFNDFFKVGVSSAGNHDNNVYNQNWSEQHHGLREVPVEATTTAVAGAGAGVGGRRGVRPPDEDEGDLWDALIRRAIEDEPQDAQKQGEQKTDEKKTEEKKETKFSIKVPTNHELAANLKNHLLLVHGDMDNNVHPAGTIRLVNALIKANKRFDFMLLPGKAHGFADMQPYFTRMMFEYFAEHLLGDYYRNSADMGGN
ncbi:MAG: DPP IV N-terminal domain-containing protein [Fimbriimonadaceae bacterium]|nr:DPP IV N-terminal domain-containing protein [Fimbriimonadaceae bacterium]